eukprot:Platyproteum_vivax@DN14053_c0_g1_i1.p1
MATTFGTFGSEVASLPGSLTLVVDPNEKFKGSTLDQRQSITEAIAVLFKTPARFYSLISHDVDVEAAAAQPPTADTVYPAFLSVTIRTPYTLPVLLALYYSFVPVCAFVGMFCWFLATEALFPFYGSMLLILVSLVSELMIKNVVREARPVESSVGSYGMPSTHCLNALSLMTWLICNSLASPKLNIVVILVTVLTLGPVPWGRYYLGDHTTKQCAVGSAGGITLGILAYFFQAAVFPHGVHFL